MGVEIRYLIQDLIAIYPKTRGDRLIVTPRSRVRVDSTPPTFEAYVVIHLAYSIMVSITVQTKGKPTITLDFADKHPDKVTIADVKTAVHTKFPKVGWVADVCRILQAHASSLRIVSV